MGEPGSGGIGVKLSTTKIACILRDIVNHEAHEEHEESFGNMEFDGLSNDTRD